MDNVLMQTGYTASGGTGNDLCPLLQVASASSRPSSARAALLVSAHSKALLPQHTNLNNTLQVTAAARCNVRRQVRTRSRDGKSHKNKKRAPAGQSGREGPGQVICDNSTNETINTSTFTLILHKSGKRPEKTSINLDDKCRRNLQVCSLSFVSQSTIDI